MCPFRKPVRWVTTAWHRRHDVVERLVLEVDQIYHLACPASPVHYKCASLPDCVFVPSVSDSYVNHAMQRLSSCILVALC